MTTPLRRIVQPRPGLDLVLREVGGGTPVLLLHGAPSPGSIAPLIDHFSPRHRVLAPVHPGWDDTARPDDLDSVTALAALYLDLLGHLDLSDVTVLGTSFGGWVAAQMAVDDRHHQIALLVLMDAIGPVVPGQPLTLPSGPPPADPSPAAAAPAPRNGPPPQTLTALRAYAGPHLQDPGLLPRLAAFTCPVLVLWGENDQVVTPAYGRAYAAAFPHAQFELIPGAGHCPSARNPRPPSPPSTASWHNRRSRQRPNPTNPAASPEPHRRFGPRWLPPPARSPAHPARDTVMTTAHHPIAIIGAGLGGLTLARVLHARGIQAAVFDLEAGRHVRTQGGMLDIHEENGQIALHAADLYEPFRKIIHEGGEAMRLLDHHADVVLQKPDDGTGGRPEVDRGQLRDLLLDSLPDGMIRWGVQAAGARPLGDGRHEVTFADGSTITADLLVGADGAWSKIRPLVSAAHPAYTGISFVELDLLEADTRHPDSADLIGGGFFIALDGPRGILAHREIDGSLHVYTALRTEEDHLDGIDFTDTAAAKAALLAHFTDWDARFQTLITYADGPLTPRRINALPIGHRWDRVPGVTLLGDAAHVMSPFAGEGANLAMLDGAELGQAIADHPGDIENALAAYEKALFARSETSATESAASLELMFGPDAVTRLAEMFTGQPG